jgi:hypothetical protein
MAEAQSGKTVLDDVSEDTFISFCQFAYTGDYSTPVFVHAPKPESRDTSSLGSSMGSPPTAIETVASAIETADGPEPFPPPADGPMEVAVVELVEADIDDWDFAPKKSKKSKKNHSKSFLFRREFEERVYDISTVRSTSKALCDIRDNQSAEEDYSPVFLGHARLYVFADKWHINELKALTLHKLHNTLNKFTLYEARRGDIVNLVEFAYSNDNTPDSDHDVDDLRALITHYITCEMESLVESPEFLSFLDQPGQFSRDLIRMMMRRIE